MGLREALGERVDPASFVAFRVMFGLVAAFAAVRFVALGWVQELLVAPSWHFVWVPGIVEPPAAILYGLFAVQAVCGVLVALGRWPRIALVGWLASFGYVELLDKSLYLNHYVLFTLLGLTLLASPVHRVRWRGPGVPRWALGLLQVQVGLVYFWAGFAKLNADWLFRAEPLTTWLEAWAGAPVVGPLLAWDGLAWAMSWGGAGYDLLIPFLLLLRRTRLLGVALVAFFHVVVGVLFPIGIFPILMIAGATLFLDASWPRRFLRGGPPTLGPARPVSRGGLVVLVAVVAVVALFPARFVLHGTDVSWTERGHRFAWRVLLNEKTGFVDYRVVERQSGRTWKVSPSRELTLVQHEQMRTQPDMIRDYALHLRDVHAAEGRDVAVYAVTRASLNGRPAQPLLREDLDLTRPLGELEAEAWIVPLRR